MKDKVEEYLSDSKVRIVGFGIAVISLVASASAANGTVDIAGTVGPILDSVTELIPTLITLIVAIVPAIIVLAVVGFIVAFFDKILGMMKI